MGSVFVRIENTIIGTVYLPPDSTVNDYVDFCNIIENVSNCFPRARIVVTGDFNLPSAHWSYEGSNVLVGSSSCAKTNIIAYCMSYLNMSQLNQKPNSRGILDLIFANFKEINIDIAIDTLSDASIHHYGYSLSLSIDTREVNLLTNNLFYPRL